MAIEFEKKSLAHPEGDAIKRRGFSFFVAAFCLITCFVTAATAIPMMAYWVQDLKLSSSEVAMSVVSYFAGCVLTLILFARLSNFLGRKPVVIAALAFGAIACYLFSVGQSASDLYIGRFLQGLSCGLATSACMSWVVDTAPPARAWLGTAMTSAGPNIGLSLGTLLTGLIIEYNVLNPALLFDACVALLIFCIVLAVLGTETMRLGTESIGQVLIPKIAIPARLRRLFILSITAFIGTWGVSSFFQGFSAQFAQIVFGESSVLLAAITYLLLIIPIAVFGLISRRFNPSKTLLLMSTGFLFGAGGVFLTLDMQSPALFMIFVVICGAAQGGTCCSGLKLLLMDATLRERAGLISALYLGAYVGSGIPNFSIGQLAKDVSMTTIANGFCLWIVVMWLIIVLTFVLIKRKPSETEKKRF
ncbi:MFS transporter [Parasutterella secunda]|uniref:MFS transporter n=1 Tax=Parasutterella secunda TaxID=626947 RepID=UPI0020126CF7|nr:MFS transporter [Parasutterella secunda]MCL1597036.1 MFS transporter [Parasutterella secunda]